MADIASVGVAAVPLRVAGPTGPAVTTRVDPDDTRSVIA